MTALNRKLIAATTAFVLVGLLICATLPQPAAGQSASDLRQKLRRLLGQEENVKEDLRDIKKRQREATTRLVIAQQELEKAQEALDDIQGQLTATRKELAQTKQQLEQSKARLAQHQTAMQRRILALYKSRQPTYLEVVLRATSFDDFVNRAEFTRRIAGADEDLLMSLVAEKQAYERQKAQLEEQERQRAALETKIRKQRDYVAARKAEAEQLAHQARTDRVEAERQLAAMEHASGQIEQMLAQLQRGESGQRYAGGWSGRLQWPVSGHRITSPFGWRIHPITHTRRFHDGVDIAMPTGSPIKAADKGLVVHSGWYGVYGKTVIIDHGSGISTMYAHCSRTKVSTGHVVSRGQVIGYIGSTGWSTGPHLHFGVRKYGKPIDPLKF